MQFFLVYLFEYTFYNSKLKIIANVIQTHKAKGEEKQKISKELGKLQKL